MRLLVWIIALTTLSACGLKDDLYLPAPKPSAASAETDTAAPGSPPADAAPASPAEASGSQENEEMPGRKSPPPE